MPSTAATSPAVPTSEPAVVTTSAVAVVAEGVECGPFGATAVFVDGATAYCARLAGTDGGAWSRNSEIAPNPALATNGIYPGAKCIGADIGRTAFDANGTSLICTNYQWQVNVGQTPEHKWADEQREWAECTELNTPAECRRILDR